MFIFICFYIRLVNDFVKVEGRVVENIFIKFSEFVVLNYFLSVVDNKKIYNCRIFGSFSFLRFYLGVMYNLNILFKCIE